MHEDPEIETKRGLAQFAFSPYSPILDSTDDFGFRRSGGARSSQPLQLDAKGLAEFIESRVPDGFLALKLKSSNTPNIKTSVTFGSSGEIDLELSEIESNVDALLQLLKLGKDAYLLMWNGSKVPSNAVVNGIEIDHTQHNMVTSDGEMVGTYDRIVEYGGPNKRAQALILYLNPPQEKKLPELKFPLSEGTLRINNLDELIARSGELVARSIDGGKSWFHFQVPQKSQIDFSLKYTKGFYVEELGLKTSSSKLLTKGIFFREIFRTTTTAEQSRYLNK